jgi:hypothetical protein
MRRLSLHITVALLLAANFSLFSQQLVIVFDNPPTSSAVDFADLKYDKDFAFSWTFDDGGDSQHSNVFPFFNGGTVSEDGLSYPGLYTTDGCGNDVAFRAGLAYFSFNSWMGGMDIHGPGAIANWTWSELVEMYNAGWDALNHQFGGPNPWITFQIQNNVDYTLAQTTAFGTPIHLSHFVIPGGEAGWIDTALALGNKSIHNEASSLDGYSFEDGKGGWRVDNVIDVEPLLLSRTFRNVDDSMPMITTKIDQVASLSTGGAKYWYSEFTHNVSNSVYSGGMYWDDFKPYMEYVEGSYGKSGSDRMWFAGVQEVWEYLHLRNQTNLDTVWVSETELHVFFDTTAADSDLRRYEYSLLIDADQNYEVKAASGIEIKSYRNPGIEPGLINLSLTDTVYTVPGFCPAPSQLAAEIPVTGNANLSWNAFLHDGFQVCGGVTDFIGTSCLTSFDLGKSISGLNPSKFYRWEVRARCTNGEISEFSQGPAFNPSLLRVANSSNLEVFPSPQKRGELIQIRGGNTAETFELINLSGQIVFVDQFGESGQAQFSFNQSGYYILRSAGEQIPIIITR